MVPDQVYTGTDAKFEEQMELMLRRSIMHTNGPAPPPGALLPVKLHLSSPPRSSPPRSRGIQIGHRVKDERLFPPPRHVVKEERLSPPPHRVVKEEEPRMPPPLAQGARAHFAQPPW